MTAWCYWQDLLLADLLDTQGDLIKKVREHDSLLENREEEQLSEEERKAAWQEYQQEKERVIRPPPTVNMQMVNQSMANMNQIAYARANQSHSALAGVLLNDVEKMQIKQNLQKRVSLISVCSQCVASQ